MKSENAQARRQLVPLFCSFTFSLSEPKLMLSVLQASLLAEERCDPAAPLTTSTTLPSLSSTTLTVPTMDSLTLSTMPALAFPRVETWQSSS